MTHVLNVQTLNGVWVRRTHSIRKKSFVNLACCKWVETLPWWPLQSTWYSVCSSLTVPTSSPTLCHIRGSFTRHHSNLTARLSMLIVIILIVFIGLLVLFPQYGRPNDTILSVFLRTHQETCSSGRQCSAHSRAHASPPRCRTGPLVAFTI